MNYLFATRLIYAFPALLYAAIYVFKHQSVVLGNDTLLLGGIFWLLAFLFSLVLYGMSTRIQPILLIHFLFLVDTIAFTSFASTTTDPVFFMFVLFSSFGAIASLREQEFSLILHLLFVTCWAGFLLSKNFFGALDGTLFASKDALIGIGVFMLILVCRAFESALDGKTVLRETHVRIREMPVDNPELATKLRRTESAAEELTKEIERLEKDLADAKDETTVLTEERKNLIARANKSIKEHQEALSGVAGYYAGFIRMLQYNHENALTEEMRKVMEAIASASDASFVGLLSEADGTLSASNAMSNRRGIDLGELLKDSNTLESIKTTLRTGTTSTQQKKEGLSPILPNIQGLLCVPCKPDGRKGVIILCFPRTNDELMEHAANLAIMGGKYIEAMFEIRKASA